jgi:hypothetical protein
MLSRLSALFLICALLFLPICSTQAQQQSGSIAELQEQIKQMEAINNDPATTQEVKNLNLEFLKTRRKQLHDLIVKNINALRQYQANLGSSLNAAESKLLENSIQNLEKILQEQEEGVPLSGLASTDVVGDSSTRPQSARSVRAANAASPQPESASSGIGRFRSLRSGNVRVAQPLACPPVNLANLPPRLDKMAEATAMLVVSQAVKDRANGVSIDSDTDISAEFEKHYDELVYLVVADALFTDAQKINLRKLKWQEFAAETARTDKQIGASARSTGSTSLAEKPNFSHLLSFAIEHGAIQKEVSDTSLTLSSSPYALIAASQGDTSDVYRRHDFFNRIGLSANFNLENKDNVLANASRRQLNEWSVKFRLNRDHTARGRDFQNFWDANVLSKVEKRAIVLTTGFNEAFNKVEDLRVLHRGVRDKFEGPTGFLVTTLNNTATTSQPDQVTSLKQEILCRLRSEVYDPVKSGTTVSVDAAFRDFLNKSIVDLAAAQLEAEEGKQDVLNELKRLEEKPTASFAYSNIHPADGSSYSIFKGLYLQKAFTPMKVLANAEVSVYNRPNTALNQQRIRDFLFALSFEGSAGRSPFISTEMDQSPITFSFTGSYQRMLENKDTAARKADLGSAQFKMEIPVFTGFSLPLSLSYVNATEERNKSGFRFNFGFGLDTDKLAALLRAKRQ